jgi:hypothetical protein
MREFIDQFNQRTINVIGALVLRGIEHKRYVIASNIEYYPIEICSEAETGSSLIYLVDYPTAPLELLRLSDLFWSLVSQWRKERNQLSSNAWNNVLNPAYLRIIGMGLDAVPFILRELRYELEIGEPDDWFVALWAITHENPVSIESRGNIKEMSKAWLEWGLHQGYLGDEILGGGVPEFGDVGRA